MRKREKKTKTDQKKAHRCKSNKAVMAGKERERETRREGALHI